MKTTMKVVPLFLAVMLSPGCATVAAKKCDASRAEFDSDYETCSECLDRLADHGNDSLCKPKCESTGASAGSAVDSCGASAREVIAKAEKAEREAAEKEAAKAEKK